MITQYMLQTSQISAPNIINVIGIIIVIGFGYYHYLSNSTDSDDVEQSARRNSLKIGALFLIYTVVVGMSGYTDTWVGQIGASVNNYFDQVGREIVLVGQSEGTGTINQVLGGLRTLGLIVYISFVGLVTGLVEWFASQLRNGLQVLKSIFGI